MKIKNGFVLDHIKAGVGVKIFKYLNLEKEGNQVALIINADSKKNGKKDIIKISMDIDCYELSIKPFEDCCTVYVPKAPATSQKIDKAIMYESKFDYEKLVDEAEKLRSMNVLDGMPESSQLSLF